MQNQQAVLGQNQQMKGLNQNYANPLIQNQILANQQLQYQQQLALQQAQRNQQLQNPVAPMQQSVMNQDFYQAQGAQTFAPNANIQPQVNTNPIDGSQPSVQNTNQGSDQLVLVENKEGIIKKIINIITGIFKKKSQ